MGVVAVAGGSGDFGRTIVDQLLSSGKHQVLVLSRSLPVAPQKNGPEFLAVSYNDIGGTAASLESHKVDTVISTLSFDGLGRQAQLDLIAAAAKSSATKRFIPSEYSTYTGPDNTWEYAAPARQAADALKKSGLQYTRFAIGCFMEYFGQPHVASHIRPFIWAVDIGKRKAAIPGTGNEGLSVTYSKDAARFVDRLLDESEWPPYSIVSGSDTSFNEIVAIAERVTGDKFDVVYESLEKLRGGNATVVSREASSYAGMDPVGLAAIIGASIIEGYQNLPKEGRLNERFPDIRPMSIEEIVTEAWSKK